MSFVRKYASTRWSALITLLVLAIGLWMLKAQSTRVDNSLTLEATRNVDLSYTVHLTSPVDGTVVIDRSTNLTSWMSITTNSVTGGQSDYVDNEAVNLDRAFYRVRVIPSFTPDRFVKSPSGKEGDVRTLTLTPPSVSITSPTNNSVYVPPTDLILSASASDSDGTVESVIFYSGDTKIGSAGGSPWNYDWVIANSGQYAISAVAMDNDGLMATSSVVNVTISLDAPTRYSGVTLWLDADQGITTDGSGNVSTWADQSGQTNNATQTTSSARPAWLGNQLNGLPVLQFDGSSDYLTLPNLLSGQTAAEIFVVAQSDVESGANHGLWKFGNGTSYFPQSAGYISEDFGSTTVRNLGDPAAPLTSYFLYNVHGQSGDWAAWMNGVLLQSSSVNTFGYYTGPRIGYGYFDGDIAEVIIYNRVLSQSERDAVGAYLNGKYALVPDVPETATNLVATAVSPTQVNLRWQGAQSGATRVSVERKTGSGGTYEVVGEVRNATGYLDTTATSGQTYYYRVRAINLTEWSDYSNEASADTPADGTVMPVADMVLWLKADSGITQNGTNVLVGTWPDQSGHGNNATTTSSSERPLWVADQLNGRPVVRFDGSSDHLHLPNLLSGTTSAEAFIVLKSDLESGSSKGLWRFGTTGFTSASYFPHSSGYITESFGSTSFYNLGDPVPPLTSFNLYDVSGQNSGWSAWMNGVLLQASSANTYGYVTAPDLGYCGGNGAYFDGDIAEVIIYNRVLSQSERDAVGAYLNGKYALVPDVPETATNLVATAVSPTQVNLRWQGAQSGATRVSVERKTGSGGTYEVVGAVRNATGYLDTTATSGQTYYYRVRAINLTEWSDYSNEASADTPADGTVMPVADMVLWLKADSGITQNGTNVLVGTWPDQSGHGNNATTTTTAEQPLWVADQLNGRPVVRFDGSSDNLHLPNLLNGSTAAEAFVVVKSDVESGANKSLWRFGNSGGGGYYPLSNGYVYEDFGSTTARSLGDPASPLTEFNIYNVLGQNGQWAARMNGSVLYSTTANTYGYSTYISIGYSGANGARFDGDVAEVIIYNRVLSQSERDAVVQYLNGKFDIIDLPTGAINLGVQVISSSQAALSWTQENVTNPRLYFYAIDRMLGTNGTFATIGEVAGLSHFVDSGLQPGTTYTYRIRNAFISGADPSNEATITTTSSVGTFPLSAVAMWFRAQDLDLTNNAKVASWPEYISEGTFVATQSTSGLQPVMATNGIGGSPAVTFGGGTYLLLPDAMASATNAEIFVVLDSTTNTPAANQGLWRFNTNASTYYPDTGGGIQDAFGSSEAHSLLAPLPDLTAPHIYNVSAVSGSWLARLDGPTKQLLSTNTATFNGTPWLGQSNGGGSEPFAGRIAQLIVFNRALTTDEQKAVRDGLAQTYGIDLELPQIPSGLSLSRTNAVDSHLVWTALTGSENGLESYFVVERRADTNSSFLALSAISRTASDYVDASGLPDVAYLYRLKAINDVGEAVSSDLDSALVDSDGDGLPDYLESQLGTNPNNSDSDGDGLPDGWEVRFGLDPLRSDGRNGASGDFDNDGISNLAEYQGDTNPADGKSSSGSPIQVEVHRPN